MPTHPRDSIPAEQLLNALDALLLTLAQDEPEALLRAARTLHGGGPSAETPSPGALLAESYLAFTGYEDPDAARAVQTYEFSHGGHIHFEVHAGSKRAAWRIARAAIAALLGSETPLGAVAGPFPGYPQLHDMTFWLDNDGELELEGTNPGQ